MNRNEILKSLVFTDEFSVEDWNTLLYQKLGKYFSTKDIFEKNKELLRTEFLNYIQFCEKKDYFNLFAATMNELNATFLSDKKFSIEEFAKFFHEMTNTDLKWLTGFITQPNYPSLLERDKIAYCFQIIDTVLEGCFKPRFRLFYEIIFYNKNKIHSDTSKMDFGQLITNFTNLKAQN